MFPILQAGGSDSACFDNCMELLVRAGRSAPHALMMMIPEAFGPRYHISTDKRAFYEYHAAIMEPWDGPAAMVFTDGRLVGGTLDRNGLRPSRYRGHDRRAGGPCRARWAWSNFRRKRFSRKAVFSPAACSWSIPKKAGSSPTTRSRAKSPGKNRIAAGWRRIASNCGDCSSRRSRRRSTKRRSPSDCGRSATRAKIC